MTDYARRLSLFVEYANGVHPQEENFARTKDLSRRLSFIHPLFAEFSYIGKRPSTKHMLGEVPLSDLSFDQWLESYLVSKKRGGSDIPEYLGNIMTYWNRQKEDADETYISIHYNVDRVPFDNDLCLADLPAALYIPEMLEAIMLVCIESFDAVRAEYTWYDSNRDLDTRHYQLWLRGNVPFPTAPNLGRFKPNHPPPPATEHWHGGTRFMWPDHDPRLIRQEYLDKAVK
jgi:hypothetical protein